MRKSTRRDDTTIAEHSLRFMPIVRRDAHRRLAYLASRATSGMNLADVEREVHDSIDVVIHP